MSREAVEFTDEEVKRILLEHHFRGRTVSVMGAQMSVTSTRRPDGKISDSTFIIRWDEVRDAKP